MGVDACQQCGVVPDDDERAVVARAAERAGAVPPTGWLCTVCRPVGFPADGLCYSVVDVVGESPEHEYES